MSESLPHLKKTAGREPKPSWSRANEAHARTLRCAHETVVHAIEAGKELLRLKANVPHGRWLVELEASFIGDARTAQRYMHLAKHAEELQRKNDTVSHLTIRDALKMLASPRKEPEARSIERMAADEPGPRDMAAVAARARRDASLDRQVARTMAGVAKSWHRLAWPDGRILSAEEVREVLREDLRAGMEDR